MGGDLESQSGEALLFFEIGPVISVSIMRILDCASAALSCSCKSITLSGRTIVALRIGEDVKRGNRD